MRVIVFDTKPYDREALEIAKARRPELNSLEFDFRTERLNSQTALSVKNATAICCFVNDQVDRGCLDILRSAGVKLIALRCAGYNQVDVQHARTCGIQVVRVPAYSPHAVAEHAVALLLSLSRRIHKAYHRVRDGNFSLDGFVGFTIHGKTVAVIGTGQIGTVFADLMLGFGARVLANDLQPNPALEKKGVQYVSFDRAISEADIISLHIPLTPETFHLFDDTTFSRTRTGVVLINTSRGKLIDTKALIRCLKSRHLGAAGLDVYEEESGVFFENLSDQIIQDDVLMRLLTFPNVLITSHQAFLTKEALSNIAGTTIDSIAAFLAKRPLLNAL